MSESGEKTQEATPHRRQQARDAGQVARSQDLSSAGLLLGGLVALVLTGGALLDFLVGMLSSHLRGETWMAWLQRGLPAEAVASQWNDLLPGLARVLLPLLALSLLAAVAVNMLQTGVLLVPHKLAPDFSRINPLAGLRRLFSAAGAVRLAFGIFKVAVIAAVALMSLYNRRGELASLGALDLAGIAVFAWDICLWTCVKIGLALLALAVLDYGFERWKHERDLKMTPQEMREEMRNLQGDPQVAARRRNVQRQSSLHRLAQVVPKADVVIVKPGELAVAIRYQADSMRAPVVVARGTGPIVERISELAAGHSVAIVASPTLARTLYDQVALNRPIPDSLYAGVAEVLAHAYQLKNKSPKAA